MFLEDCLAKFLSCDHLPKVVSKKRKPSVIASLTNR